MTGTLGLFSLVDLFQLLASSARTGRLGVRHPQGPARIYFDKGQVVHAEFGPMAGVEAVYALFEREEGSFEFTVGLPPPRVSIATSTENVILDAIRRLDERRRDQPQTSVARDAVLALGDRDLGKLTLHADEFTILAQVNGARNVTQIAVEAGLEPELVMEVVGRLLKVGALRLNGKRPRTARLVSRLAAGRFPSGAAGLDPGILTTWERATGHAATQVACRFPDGRVTVYQAEPVSGAGPYIHFSRETMAQGGLAVDLTLLVRPVPRQS